MNSTTILNIYVGINISQYISNEYVLCGFSIGTHLLTSHVEITASSDFMF